MKHHQISSLVLYLQKLCLSAPVCKSGFLIMLALLLSITVACEEEVPLPMQITDAEAPKEKVPDAEPLPILPQSLNEVVKNLPYPPDEIKRKPGDAVGNLRRQLPSLQKLYSARFLAETRSNGPFRNVVYQLSKNLRKIEAITATFHPEYKHDARYKDLKNLINNQLGQGRAFNERNWEGTRWTNLDYRIELRVDRVSKDVELVFHQRGAEDLERTKRGIPKSIRK